MKKRKNVTAGSVKMIVCGLCEKQITKRQSVFSPVHDKRVCREHVELESRIEKGPVKSSSETADPRLTFLWMSVMMAVNDWDLNTLCEKSEIPRSDISVMEKYLKHKLVPYPHREPPLNTDECEHKKAIIIPAPVVSHGVMIYCPDCNCMGLPKQNNEEGREVKSG